MSWRDFWRRPQGSPPHVRDSDFTYLTPDDIVEPSRQHHQPQYIERRPLVSSDENGPDILLLVHRGVTYPLHFRPFAIDDRELTIGDIRRRAAEKTGTADVQRIKLLYKGKLLRDDTRPCKDEGLKQQSEIMCNDKSEAVSLDSDDRHPGQPDKEKTSKKGKKKKNKNKSNNQPQRSSDVSADGGLAPPTEHRPTSSGRSSAPSPSPSFQNARTGNDKVDVLLNYLRSELAPMCDEYIAHPPTDLKARDFEHKRLSEAILAQVILKADGIDSEDARTARRALIKEAQSMLNRIDEAHRNQSSS
ncbi:hypothetical protein BGW36DRAFT_302540 [Talaromyces proteolyticus]|uniref:BAG domain-containing protein n=1 Tax=Talaromyces proteolyticus TaxID=1131652 RepID=A0AAD4PXI6_9EURO|nr:uncharacterized protein BGW36DRAFT_302540 [Talaromyces proteolyticus]KAH8692763.1 hypothetical protein BGW36DRAFT_302540 [Talaromyces proteolyticus]